MRRSERKYLFAIGLSLLVHLALLQWHFHLQGVGRKITSKPFEVVLHLLPTHGEPPLAPSAPLRPAVRVTRPAPAVAPPPRTSPPAPSREPVVALPAEVQMPSPPEPSLLDRARASIKDVDRTLREEDSRGPWMVKPKPLPPSLARLPEEAKTALQKSFEDHLGEEVVLDVHEHQEGNNRVTMIHTNKGRYCVYEPVLNHVYMGNVPQIARVGDCGPQS